MTLADDPLLAWRAAFPALESCVHLVSYSLGCVPAKAVEDLAEFYDLWQTRSITAWDAWVPEVGHAAARIERLLSAPAGTVAIQPNVSAAIACVASCSEFAAPRNRVVYESLMFPSVSYVRKAEERRGAVFSVGALWHTMLTGKTLPDPFELEPIEVLGKVQLPPRLLAVLARGAGPEGATASQRDLDGRGDQGSDAKPVAMAPADPRVVARTGARRRRGCVVRVAARRCA